MDWVLPYAELRRLQSRALRAQRRDFSEVAGLLVSGSRRRLKLWFLPNHSAHAGHFTIELDDVAAARRRARSRGARVVGLFHSHPLSRAVLGPGDRRGAVLNWLRLVYDVCERDVRLWRVYRHNGRRRVREVGMQVERRKA